MHAFARREIEIRRLFERILKPLSTARPGSLLDRY
jgi:hypothetical protein